MEQVKPPSKPAASRSTRSPISIAFLFYLVTLGAIISACLRTLVGSEQVTGQLLALLVFSCLALGLLAGGLAGGLYFKGWKAAGVGTLVGAVVGAIAGGLALIQHEHFFDIAWTAFLGCWLILVVVLVAARFQTQTQL